MVDVVVLRSRCDSITNIGCCAKYFNRREIFSLGLSGGDSGVRGGILFTLKYRLSYTCDQCESKCTCRDPATLVRADPANPRITEDPDIRPTQTRTARRAPVAQAQGTRKSPRLATLAPVAGGQPAAAAQMANAGAHAPQAPPPRPATL